MQSSQDGEHQRCEAKLGGPGACSPGKFLRNWCKMVHSESYLLHFGSFFKHYS